MAAPANTNETVRLYAVRGESLADGHDVRVRAQQWTELSEAKGFRAER